LREWRAAGTTYGPGRGHRTSRRLTRTSTEWAILVSNQWPLPCEGNTARSGYIRSLPDGPEKPGTPGFSGPVTSGHIRVLLEIPRPGRGLSLTGPGPQQPTAPLQRIGPVASCEGVGAAGSEFVPHHRVWM